MIEVTPELIDRYAQLMSEHAGYAVSRNTERILQDLVKQAEITERSASSIPVTLKMTVIMTEEGELKLALDDVSWKVMSRSKDDDFYTVPLDDKQMELPGLERNPPPKPVVDVKALPEHKDDGEASDSESEKDLTGLKELLDGEQFLKVACSTNLEGAADAQAMKIFAPLPSSDNRVAIYASGSWKTQIVPNVKSALEAADDGNNIVFGPDGLMTHQTMISLSTSGFGIVAVYRTLDGHLLRKESMDGVTFVEHEDLDDNEKDRRYLLDELKTIMENDDCLLMFQAEFYGFDGLK